MIPCLENTTISIKNFIFHDDIFTHFPRVKKPKVIKKFAIKAIKFSGSVERVSVEEKARFAPAALFHGYWFFLLCSIMS